MIAGPVNGKNCGMPSPFVRPASPPEMGECFQTFIKAVDVPFHAVWVGV
jgi:hypothetical protein